MGDGCHAHGGSGVTGVCCEGGIDLFRRTRELETLLKQLEELGKKRSSTKHTRWGQLEN
jgi:hypothetical protein